jgi:hypothetical protein
MLEGELSLSAEIRPLSKDAEVNNLNIANTERKNSNHHLTRLVGIHARI